MGRARQLSNMPNAPAFSAFRTSDQALTTGTFVKVACNSTEFNLGSAFSTSTNKFTPQVAGYYQVNAQVLIAGGTLTAGVLLLYKNGALHKHGGDIRGVSGGYLAPTLSALVYMNGSTDYLELYAYAEGTSLSLQGTTATDNYFQACLIRPA